ncbi:FAD-dependent oxidoreductase [Rhizobacter sp. SG703]|uniref:FAD-dependent oxidoreductase n=1 Tax=Rhizobacter sp. SG703 TaxID=2587140 RepID=UPI0014475034|nr:FAD-dependent oxidoreductase [Rhizobacter sp. SG703]NKI95256.1 NADPH-dependent 2,4-dienoyl-CoA reductase/sulfur reductase-like enzyme/nitrite reductase/ring-hydroxylating ferredoxin subunit [Rhizobacter sp. SG703]
MSDNTPPDLQAGIPLERIADGAMLAGRIDGEDALLVRQGDAVYAIGAQCSHYHAALADGLLDGHVLHCPMHHAQFDIRSGTALCAPALDDLPCWRVEQQGGQVFARERIVAAPRSRRQAPSDALDDVVIVGGGAAGLAAADTLRREGYDGRLAIVSADADPPVDRPNLSKDFLAGTAEADWMPLRPDSWYAERRIELLLGTRVDAIDVAARRLQLAGGATRPFGALLLATGADPVRLDVPGAAPGQVLRLRSFADSRAIVARAASARSALVIGASFIGLEVAASLRTRGLAVHVVAPDAVPMQRVLGPDLGAFVRDLHASHGVVFHLGTTLDRLDGTQARLADGTVLAADLVVAGVGVRPALALAEQAGLAVDRGVSVDAWLQTSAPGIFAAGDIARWPDPHSGERIRVEHWTLAERQGQVAALNMLGRRRAFDISPFFWSQHYDVTLQYVGHAERWDAIEIDGSLAQHDCSVRYRLGGRVLAVVTIGRDLESLRAERALEADRVPVG